MSLKCLEATASSGGFLYYSFVAEGDLLTLLGVH